MRICIIVVILVTTACGPDKSVPSIEDEKLLPLFFDLQTAKVAIEKSLPEDRDSLSSVYRQQILDMHNVSEEQLDETVSYLYDHPSVMDSLYKEMTQMIDTVKSSLRYEN